MTKKTRGFFTLRSSLFTYNYGRKDRKEKISRAS